MSNSKGNGRNMDNVIHASIDLMDAGDAVIVDIDRVADRDHLAGDNGRVADDLFAAVIGSCVRWKLASDAMHAALEAADTPTDAAD